MLRAGSLHKALYGTRGQDSSHGTALSMLERLPCISVQIIIDTSLQVVLSKLLPLLLPVLVSEIAGAKTNPAP